jgi:hypothetical protein
MGVLDFSIVTSRCRRSSALSPDPCGIAMGGERVRFGIRRIPAAADVADSLTQAFFIPGLGLFSACFTGRGLARFPWLSWWPEPRRGWEEQLCRQRRWRCSRRPSPRDRNNRALGVFGSMAGIGFSAGVIRAVFPPTLSRSKKLVCRIIIVGLLKNKCVLDKHSPGEMKPIL